MLPAAQAAQFDFVRLVAEEPSSLYFEQFLREGFQAWPRAYQYRFPGLATWHGVRGLKQSLRRLTGGSGDGRVLLASRSLPLVRLGAAAMFRVCRNVLTTDCSWPTYQRAVTALAQRTDSRVTLVELRKHVLYEKWTDTEVVHWLRRMFIDHECDGLFLPAVDHLGIRLPLEVLIRSIKAVAELRFVLVDAAQAFCHVPLADFIELAEFVVAGGHKWMGAYLPLGIAFYGCHRTRAWIERCVRRSTIRGRGDQLTIFTEQLDGRRTTQRGETVNLASLFAAAGAANDQHHLTTGDGESVTTFLRGTSFPGDLWKPILPAPSLRSRIALVQCKSPRGMQLTADEVRRKWLRTGAVATGYDGGLARLSFCSRIAPPTQRALALCDPLLAASSPGW